MKNCLRTGASLFARLPDCVSAIKWPLKYILVHGRIKGTEGWPPPTGKLQVAIGIGPLEKALGRNAP